MKLILLFLLLVPALVILPFYIIYRPPHFVVRYFQFRYPDVLFQVTLAKDAPKVVALTIDDAPSKYTVRILDLLAEHNATATFFCIGSQINSKEARITLKRVISEGHELGNHAMHDEPSVSLPTSTLALQVLQVDKILGELYADSTERQPKYFRPGSGLFKRGMQEMIARLGYRLVLGSIYPHDPQIPYPRINAHHILSMVRSGGIIICHDRRDYTVEMLEIVLPRLMEMGYKVVRLTDLIQLQI